MRRQRAESFGGPAPFQSPVFPIEDSKTDPTKAEACT